MAERRMIARSISVSEQVAALETDFARLLFTWMVTHADDYGVMPGSPAKVRALVVPMLDHTANEVGKALEDMEAHALIGRYEVDGTSWLQFRTWETHQQGLHKRTDPKQPVYHMPENSGKTGTSLEVLENDRVSEKFQKVPGSSIPHIRAHGTEVEVEPEEEIQEKGHAAAARIRAATLEPESIAAACSSGSQQNPPHVIDLCKWVATQTHLPTNKPDEMKHLEAVLETHLRRNLSPNDIRRDVLSLMDPTRKGYTAQPTITHISNWLTHAQAVPDIAMSQIAGGNGHGQHPLKQASRSSRPRNTRITGIDDGTDWESYALTGDESEELLLRRGFQPLPSITDAPHASRAPGVGSVSHPLPATAWERDVPGGCARRYAGER
jgi:hypothetical protein